MRGIVSRDLITAIQAMNCAVWLSVNITCGLPGMITYGGDQGAARSLDDDILADLAVTSDLHARNRHA